MTTSIHIIWNVSKCALSLKANVGPLYCIWSEKQTCIVQKCFLFNFE